MTKDSQFVRAVYLGRDLPPIGTQTEYGKIMSYNSNGTIRVGGIVLVTETGVSHQDTLHVNAVKLLDCKRNQHWIVK